MKVIKFTFLLAVVISIFSIMGAAGLRGTIEFTIVDESNHQPLKGVKITILSEGDHAREYSGFTDTEGKWLIHDLDPFKYKARAELMGYLNREFMIRVRPGVKVQELCIMRVPPEKKLKDYNESISARDAAEKEPDCIDSRQMKTTIITSYPQREIAAGNNVVYCSTFQLVWDLMRYNIIKEDIKLEGDPAAVQYLNTGLSKRSDVSEDSIVTVVDRMSRELVDRIKSELKAKFNDEMPFPFEDPGQSELEIPSYYAFSAMFKNLQFASVFESLPDSLNFKSDSQFSPVRAFGIKVINDDFKEQSDQVRILDYMDDEDFIIELISKSPDDRIILAKITPGVTLSDTIEAVQTRISDGVPGQLMKDETLQIPVIDFNVKHEFEDLINRHLRNHGWESWFVGRASQWIRFKLNEKGAILKAAAELRGALGIDMGKPKLRKFIFNKPFLVIMQEKTGGYPYFAAWIANTELLYPEVAVSR